MSNSMQALSTLPNREGFKFRGIRKDGKRYLNCRLKHLPGLGMFITARGEHVYEDVTPKLAGWEPHPSRKTESRSEPAPKSARGESRHLGFNSRRGTGR